MIRYSLACEHDHPFEGWFGSARAFASQKKRGLLACPTCGVKKHTWTLQWEVTRVFRIGEKDDATLLGAVTLEAVGMMLDPLKRQLRPLPMLLA